MKLFRTNLLYIAITALITLQIPIAIAGNSPEAGTLTHYLKETKEAAKVEMNAEEMIAAKADSIYDTLHLLQAGLQEEAFELAYEGYYKLLEQGKMSKKDVLTIADFSKPSSEKRLFVIDMEKGKILFHTLVAHGRNSGLVYATEFSNKFESNKSSLGFYLTMQTYYGGKGYALRLQGLEKGINDNAFERAIVLHGSDYVTSQFANSNGYLGRSLGCPAVPTKQTKPIINSIKNGSLLFIYHPTEEYKSKSTILNS
ncbi:murein L,D-transpeptidase catalytic domain family protein [Lacibacter sp. H375]|uniref:murein L,D-transpeptidase catalytic domain family protein n=1 Tax=Lacibacter sp. H375 TaxID=3133424 RepID=UPI0030C6583E